jgi:hypothetical protein
MQSLLDAQIALRPQSMFEPALQLYELGVHFPARMHSSDFGQSMEHPPSTAMQT